MKFQIRRGVFETNSSSVHSLVMCSDDDYNKWKKGELLYSTWDASFYTLEEALKEALKEDGYENTENIDLNMLSEDFKHRFLDYERFNSWDYMNYETFDQTYTTPGGEIVHGFGYYGHD